MVRMDEAHPDVAAAGRSLARCRWGNRRVNTLVSELAERREQLTAAHYAALGVEPVASRGALAAATPSDLEDLS